MLDVWLEFLDERQQRDETVIMKVIYSDQTPEQTQGQTQEQTQELTQEHDDNSCPDNKTISGECFLVTSDTFDTTVKTMTCFDLLHGK